jgi:alpha-beta hydrolase superfamily lysophospholipase
MESATRRRGPLAFLRRTIAALAVLIVVAVALAWYLTLPDAPDAFYSRSLPGGAAAGTLVASEPYTKTVPDNARGWRILYATTRSGKPAMASAVVLVPRAATSAPLPVVAWAHGTTGIAAACAPSVLDKPFDNVPDIAALVNEGWAYVGTDYPGLGTPGGHTYLVGDDAAHAVLDAVRAARQLTDASLGDRVVVWGHSQGGNSALWTGIRAAEFAPDLQIEGVLAAAPASNLKGLLESARSNFFGKMVSAYLVTAYAQAYPDVKVSDYVGAFDRLVSADIAARCVSGYKTLFAVAETMLLPAGGIFATDPSSGPLGERLAGNSPSASFPAPLLLAQGAADDLVRPEVQRAFAASLCASGQQLDYRTYPGRDHVSVMAKDSPLAADLIAWTRDRFAGNPFTPNCPT